MYRPATLTIIINQSILSKYTLIIFLDNIVPPPAFPTQGYTSSRASMPCCTRRAVTRQRDSGAASSSPAVSSRAEYLKFSSSFSVSLQYQGPVNLSTTSNGQTGLQTAASTTSLFICNKEIIIQFVSFYKLVKKSKCKNLVVKKIFSNL